MRRSSTATFFLLVAVLVGAAAAFGIVLKQRFNGGDVNPLGSTLRADPLGAKALYDALARVPGITCQRNFHPLEKLNGQKGGALVLLNVAPTALDYGAELNAEAIQRFAAGGGRVIITLVTQISKFAEAFEKSEHDLDKEEWKRKIEKSKDDKTKKSDEKEMKGGKEKTKPTKEATAKEKSDKKTNGKTKSPDKKDEGDVDDDGHLVKEARSFSDVFGVSAKKEYFKPDDEKRIGLIWDASLPFVKEARPNWHGLSHFNFAHNDEDKSRWYVLASHNGGFMLVERRVGAGSIVLASDGFFATNEGLRTEPRPEFLSWIMDGATNVIFDETHLGVHESPNIMTLARRNHLHGLFIGGLLLFGLFVWRSGMSLVPHRDDDLKTGGAVAGHGATAGLVSLLRRGVTPSALLTRCVESWQKSSAARPASIAVRMGKAKEIIASENSKSRWQRKNAVAYQKMCALIHQDRS